MRIEELGSNVLMFVGDDYESVATAFIDGDDVLLIDSLAGLENAAWMRRILCEDLGKTVRVMAATHFMSDHMAGMSLDRLRDAVIRIRANASPHEVDQRIAEIRIEQCLAANVEPTVFEREWHQRNLDVIVAQATFALDTAIASRVAHT